MPLSLLGLILAIVVACIPREDPPEKTQTLVNIGNLPQEINENSGMIETGDLIWFINDSGGESVLYGYDRESKTITRRVVIKNTVNTDWEGITQNEHSIFIGDFGNNVGNRTDLRIIRINKTDLMTGSDTIAPAGIIEFNYEDQTDFTPADQETSYDCEAFIATEDSLILFTKDWVNLTTQLYTLPITSGIFAAGSREQWNINGLITAAAWSADDQVLYLLGYSLNLVPFLWTYSGFDASNLNYHARDRIDFTSFLGTQTEGMLISADGSVLISSEAFESLGRPASLFILEDRE